MEEKTLPKILIVDEHRESRRASEAILSGLPAELLFASSGAMALGIVMGQDVAVVLMEASMSGLDGYATAVAMRAGKNMRQTPIIFVTESHVDEAAECLGYEAGAVDFLYKPLNPTILRSKVEVFLNLFRLQREIRNQNMILEERVAERTTELKDACDAAESANVAKDEFLANMSHEIRTPMTAILGFTDILLDSLTDPKDIEAARTVKQNGDHLLELINDILDLSKIESGKLRVEQIECSPHQMVAEVVSLMRVRADAKNLPLRAEFHGPIPETIVSDPTRLRQILINIVGNAIKFTQQGSVRLTTRLLHDDQRTVLQFNVIDTGIGIPSDKIQEVFEPFSQADGSTTRKYGGTGLGLAISKRLVSLLNGEFTVSSAVNCGSTFSLTIPTGPLNKVQLISNASEAERDRPASDATNSALPSLSHRRILLAEDGPDNQRLIRFLLQKAGAEVTVAENGKIAVGLASESAAKGHPFDVILMDMQMPVLDGYAATRLLRDEGYRFPVIALTAHAMATDRQKCLDAGCDDYTTKPVDRHKLVALVARYATRDAKAPIVLEHNSMSYVAHPSD